METATVEISTLEKLQMQLDESIKMCSIKFRNKKKLKKIVQQETQTSDEKNTK